MADSKASSFTITELGGQRRTLQLRERALPYWGFPLGVKQRVETTWYPGNPIASAQVLGRQLKDAQLSGVWKDRFIKAPITVAPTDPDFARLQAMFSPPALLNGIPVFDSLALMVTMESICEEGQLLQVTWDEIVREGFLSEFEGKPDRRQDIPWTATFTWVSKGEKQGPAVFSLEVDQSDVLGQLGAAVNQLTTNAQAAFETIIEFGREMNAGVTQAQSAVSDASDMVGQIVDASLAPVDAARRAAAIQDQVVSAGLDVMDTTQARVDVEIVPGDPGTVPVGRKLFIQKFLRAARASARAMAGQAAVAREAFLARVVTPQVIASFVARDGVDLRDVSSHYYGTPTGWRQIARFNRLRTSQVPVGVVVYIPKLDFQGS